MSGQSNGGGKNQSTQPGQYGQYGQYGQPYGYYNPAQQGSYYSVGGSNRPSGGPDAPIPGQFDPSGAFGSFGAFGAPNPAFSYGGIFGSNTGYTPYPGTTTPGYGAAPGTGALSAPSGNSIPPSPNSTPPGTYQPMPSGGTPGQLPSNMGPFNPNYGGFTGAGTQGGPINFPRGDATPTGQMVPRSLSTSGLSPTQVAMGMGTTPQGTMAFQGSIAQLDPGTARMLGFTQQGGNYVNSAGQVVGRV